MLIDDEEALGMRCDACAVTPSLEPKQVNPSFAGHLGSMLMGRQRRASRWADEHLEKAGTWNMGPRQLQVSARRR